MSTRYRLCYALGMNKEEGKPATTIEIYRDITADSLEITAAGDAIFAMEDTGIIAAYNKGCWQYIHEERMIPPETPLEVPGSRKITLPPIVPKQ
jgi:hypothetical protein